VGVPSWVLLPYGPAFTVCALDLLTNGQLMCMTWDVLEMGRLETVTNRHVGCHAVWEVLSYTVKKFNDFPVPSRDVTD
jgi:hypothetical protein